MDIAGTRHKGADQFVSHFRRFESNAHQQVFPFPFVVIKIRRQSQRDILRGVVTGIIQLIIRGVFGVDDLLEHTADFLLEQFTLFVEFFRVFETCQQSQTLAPFGALRQGVGLLVFFYLQTVFHITVKAVSLDQQQ